MQQYFEKSLPVKKVLEWMQYSFERVSGILHKKYIYIYIYTAMCPIGGK